MKHKVSELEGAMLDAAVAKAVGVDILETGREFRPSVSWSVAGPIIEREIITFFEDPNWNGGALGTERFLAGYKPWVEDKEMGAGSSMTGPWTICDARIMMSNTMAGPTPLIAAMRAYCASKFGEEVELP